MPAVQLSGLEKAINGFNKKIQSFVGDGVRVEGTVGYRAPYAIYVHENMEIDHPVHVGRDGTVRNCGGQAKFLEIPAREMIPRIKDEMARMQKNKKGLRFMVQTMLDRLLRASQRLVPVDTGVLKRSGFTRLKIRNSATGRFQ